MLLQNSLLGLLLDYKAVLKRVSGTLRRSSKSTGQKLEPHCPQGSPQRMSLLHTGMCLVQSGTCWDWRSHTRSQRAWNQNCKINTWLASVSPVSFSLFFFFLIIVDRKLYITNFPWAAQSRETRGGLASGTTPRGARQLARCRREVERVTLAR